MSCRRAWSLVADLNTIFDGPAAATDSGGKGSGGAELSPAFRLSVILNLLLTFILGILTGAVIGANEAHGIRGVPKEAGGLPIVVWLRSGGDLHVAHFLGLHALQVLLLTGSVASRIAQARATPLVGAAAAASTAALPLFA